MHTLERTQVDYSIPFVCLPFTYNNNNNLYPKNIGPEDEDSLVVGLLINTTTTPVAIILNGIEKLAFAGFL